MVSTKRLARGPVRQKPSKQRIAARGDNFDAHDVTEAIALADRILLIENGAIALDVAVDLPRPRRRASPEAAALEESILARLLSENASLN